MEGTKFANRAPMRPPTIEDVIDLGAEMSMIVALKEMSPCRICSSTSQRIEGPDVYA
jgi:hypothetical protein